MTNRTKKYLKLKKDMLWIKCISPIKIQTSLEGMRIIKEAIQKEIDIKRKEIRRLNKKYGRKNRW